MYIEILYMRRLHKGSVILRKTKQSIYLQEIRAHKEIYKKIHGRAVQFQRFHVNFFSVQLLHFSERNVNLSFTPLAQWLFIALLPEPAGHSCIHIVLNSIDQSRTRWRFLQDTKKLFFVWWKHYLEWKGCLLTLLFTEVCKANYLQKCQFYDKRRQMLATQWKASETFWHAFTTRTIVLLDKGVLCRLCFVLAIRRIAIRGILKWPLGLHINLVGFGKLISHYIVGLKKPFNSDGTRFLEVHSFFFLHVHASSNLSYISFQGDTCYA